MPICVFDVYPDGTSSVPEDQDLTGPGCYRWWHFDLSEPGLEEWAASRLPAIPAASLLQAETRPRCDRYDDGLILNLRGINMNEGQHADRMVTVRMWVTGDVIVTSRVRRVFAIDEIRQKIASQSAPPSVAAFLDDLVQRLVERVQTHIMEISEVTDDFEEGVAEEDATLPPDLGETRRSVIRLRRYLEPQRVALQQLSNVEAPLLSDDDRFSLRELANRSTIAVEELDALRDRLASIQDHHDAKTSLRLGRNGYVLSVIAAIFLPLGFLTGLFGVNVGGMPGVNSELAFATLSLAMAVLALVMALIMRWLRWL